MFHQRNCDLSMLEKTVDGAYRIKADIANEPKYKCKKCGAPVTDCTTQLCLDCFNKNKQIALGAVSKAAGVVIDRNTLAELVHTKPATEVAKYYGVSDKTIAKWCKSFGIERPPRGYWAKVYAGKIKGPVA